MYFVIIFISPLYFLLRKKWGGFIINTIIYLIALFFVFTVIFIWVAPVLWILAMGHALWMYRKELMEEQAEMIAEKIAGKVKDKE